MTRKLQSLQAFVRERVQLLRDEIHDGASEHGDSGDVFLEYEPSAETIVTFDGKPGFEELERYWVNEPYAFVAILHDGDAPHYHVVEPALTEFEQKLLTRVLDDLRDILIHRNFTDDDSESGTDEYEAVFKRGIRDLLNEYGLQVTPDTFYRIFYFVWRAYIGNGKLDPILNDPNVEDISCDGHDIPIHIYHTAYQNMRTNVVFDENELDSFVVRLAQQAGKTISLENPLTSTILDDGSRIELTYEDEITRRGSTFTIRKFSEEPFTPIELINNGTFSIEQIAYLWLAIENGKSLIFAGGTASGKTTSMNAVSMFIPPRSKVISIEDIPEIQLHHENWVPSVSREGPGIETEIDMFTLLRSALRQRPEYIIVGEVRGEEALTLFQAMNTGHTTYSTLHAESLQTAINRLENPPINVPRTMFQALDIISIQVLTRIDDERVRRTNALVEIAGIDEQTDSINFVNLFEWDPATDTVDRTGRSRVLTDISQELGIREAEIQHELERRERVLRQMQAQGITGYKEFTRYTHEYYNAPDEVLRRLEAG